jgi:hypothetical protein
METMQQPIPHARAEGLVIQELTDEVLVYDLERHRSHCLNQTAAFVWRRCDGRTTVPEMAMLLQQELSVPANEEAVWLALDRLGRAHLLRERLRSPIAASRSSRRMLMRRLAVVGGLALVTSIHVPVAAAGGSVPIGGLCFKNKECASNHCCAAGSGHPQQYCTETCGQGDGSGFSCPQGCINGA